MPSLQQHTGHYIILLPPDRSVPFSHDYRYMYSFTVVNDSIAQDILVIIDSYISTLHCPVKEVHFKAVSDYLESSVTTITQPTHDEKQSQTHTPDAYQAALNHLHHNNTVHS